MGKPNPLTNILAGVGTALVWLPVLAPVVLAVAATLATGRFLFDYLMPAELFPSFLVGGGLLLWAAWRVRARRRLIAGAFALALAALAGTVGVAELTGLASGRTPPTGWEWRLALSLLAVYGLAMVAVGVGGALLLRDLLTTHGDRRGEGA